MIRHQAVRFGLTGLVNTGVSYLTFSLALYCLRGTGSAAMFSQALGYMAGILTSFFLNRKWTFAQREARHLFDRFFLFVVLQLTFLAGSSMAIGFLADVRGYHPHLSWLAVMAAVTILNFLGQKYWVFRRAEG